MALAPFGGFGGTSLWDPFPFGRGRGDLFDFGTLLPSLGSTAPLTTAHPLGELCAVGGGGGGQS